MVPFVFHREARAQIVGASDVVDEIGDVFVQAVTGSTVTDSPEVGAVDALAVGVQHVSIIGGRSGGELPDFRNSVVIPVVPVGKGGVVQKVVPVPILGIELAVPLRAQTGT